MSVHAILSRPGQKDGKEWMTGGFAKMQQVIPKDCVPHKFETEERQSLDERSEK
jgi:hypothetical protein